MPARKTPARGQPTIVPAKRMVTRTQAAAMYAVSTHFLKRQTVDDLPCHKLGHRTVLYDINDLEAFFRRRRRAG